MLSTTAVVAMVNFTFMNLLPYFWAMVPTSAFQDDILRFNDAYAPGADIVHSEGLAEATAHYGDDAFPYYLFSNMQVIGGIMTSPPDSSPQCCTCAGAGCCRSARSR